MNSDKAAIHQAFDLAVLNYDSKAMIQRRVAMEMVEWIDQAIPIQNVKSALDLGCGTGFLAHALLRKNQDLAITLNDMVPAMVERARESLSSVSLLDTYVGDIERWRPDKRWDLVVSSFAWQWLENPKVAFREWAKRSESMAVVVPIEGSFQEWKNLYESLGYESRLRRLPTRDEVEVWGKSVAQSSFQIEEREYQQVVDSPLEFAREMRAMGAGVSASDGNFSTLLRVERAYPGEFTFTWRVAYLLVKA